MLATDNLCSYSNSSIFFAKKKKKKRRNFLDVPKTAFTPPWNYTVVLFHTTMMHSHTGRIHAFLFLLLKRFWIGIGCFRVGPKSSPFVKVSLKLYFEMDEQDERRLSQSFKSVNPGCVWGKQSFEFHVLFCSSQLIILFLLLHRLICARTESHIHSVSAL